MNRLISFIDIENTCQHSVVSLNFAIALMHQVKVDVAVADISNSISNDLSLLLNLKSDKQVSEQQIKNKFSRDLLDKHASGISVLCGLKFNHNGNNIYDNIIAGLKETYGWTIIKTDSSCVKNFPVLLDSCDLMLLAVDSHILGIKKCQEFINELKSIHYPVQLVKILLKNPVGDSNISRQEIEKYLGIDVLGEVLIEPEVMRNSINEGNPAVLSSPHSLFARSLKEIANKIINNESSFFKNNTGLLSDFRKNRVNLRDELKSRDTKVSVSDGKSDNREKLIVELKTRIHKMLIDELDLKNLDLKGTADPQKQQEVRKITLYKIEHLLAEEGTEIYSRAERSRIVNELMDEVLGLGALEKFIQDPGISEIMVNGKDKIYIERGGKLIMTDSRFDNDSQIITVIDRILAPIGRRVDESSPLVDARLADGSRVNVVIPPLSLIGPAITIRKFLTNRLDIEDLIKIGSITKEMVDLLKICVILRKNIVVSGGTGSGKTTLLNMLSSFIPEDERIVTIEDSAELKLRQEHVITLESRPPSIEGTGEIPIRRLVINTLRMRPDRIIVGECRGSEAIDMLQAMNTGHDGSLTTIHSNSPRDAVSRLTTMVMMAGTELPERAIREQIAGAIDLFIQISRFSDGTRKVTKISELLSDSQSNIILNDIFEYTQEGIKEGKVTGRFLATGYLPSFFNEIESHGLVLDKKIFESTDTTTDKHR